jgi:AbrB family looped-hinge helix DNA binding protein
METKVSSKGQVVLPGPLLRTLGILPGDRLDANIEAGRIVLTPRKKRSYRIRIISDPVTGLPTLSAGIHAPLLRNKDVAKILANYP